MNPEGLKKNLGTILFLMVLAVVLGFFCWKLLAALTEQKAVVAELDSEQTRLTDLQRVKPFFPSTANLEIVRQNRLLIQEIYQHLHTTAFRPVAIPKVDRVQWQSLLGQKLSELNRDARRAKINLPGPDRYAFSFEKYLVTFPPASAVDKLTKQLIAIDKLARMLYHSGETASNGVYSLEAVVREPVGNTAEEEPEPPLQQLPNGMIFRRTPFELRFTCSTGALRHFINSLSTADWLLVIRSLDIQVKTVALALPVESAAAAAGGPHRMVGPHGELLMLGPHGESLFAPAPGRTVPETATAVVEPSAQKLERDELSVTLKIDLVEFPLPRVARARTTAAVGRAEKPPLAPTHSEAKPPTEER